SVSTTAGGPVAARANPAAATSVKKRSNRRPASGTIFSRRTASPERHGMAAAYHHLMNRLRERAAPDGDSPPDAALRGRFARGGAAAAFELLLRRHGPTVWRLCRRLLGGAHDAEDAFQATFLALVRRAAAIRTREAVGGWLARVAYRVALRV